MKGYETYLRQFIDGSNMQLIIPVYQRNYNWSTANCDKLLSDLESLIPIYRVLLPRPHDAFFQYFCIASQPI